MTDQISETTVVSNTSLADSRQKFGVSADALFKASEIAERIDALLDYADRHGFNEINLDLPAGFKMSCKGAIRVEHGESFTSFGFGESSQYQRINAIKLIAALLVYVTYAEPKETA